jgi:hypothetical protein
MSLSYLWSGALPNIILKFAEVEWSLRSGVYGAELFFKVKLSQTNP